METLLLKIGAFRGDGLEGVAGGQAVQPGMSADWQSLERLHAERGSLRARREAHRTAADPEGGANRGLPDEGAMQGKQAPVRCPEEGLKNAPALDRTVVANHGRGIVCHLNQQPKQGNPFPGKNFDSQDVAPDLTGLEKRRFPKSIAVFPDVGTRVAHRENFLHVIRDVARPTLTPS
jgi:hypothetical protein